MHLETKVIEHSGNCTYTLIPIGDIHLGTVHCDRAHLERDIKRIADDPYALWIGMGDMCECITATDPRFMASEVDPQLLPHLGTIAKSQFELIYDYFRPIKDKCIGLLEGNHEFQIKARHYLDLTLDAARELGVPYLGDTAFIRLVFRKVGEDKTRQRSMSKVIYAEHGTGGGRYTGGKLNALEHMMRDFDADIYLRGHVHTKGGVKEPRLSMPDHGKSQLVARTRIAALTGCYYRTYSQGSSSYGQRQSYPPTELGSVSIRINTKTGDMELVN